MMFSYYYRIQLTRFGDYSIHFPNKFWGFLVFHSHSQSLQSLAGLALISVSYETNVKLKIELNKNNYAYIHFLKGMPQIHTECL